jgi:hypothetical protein
MEYQITSQSKYFAKKMEIKKHFFPSSSFSILRLMYAQFMIRKYERGKYEEKFPYDGNVMSEFM